MQTNLYGSVLSKKSWVSLVMVFTLLCSWFLFIPKAHAATINVSTNSQLASAVANATPGDVIVLADGNYSGLTIQTQGTATAPIEIRAANQGKAVFNTGAIYLQNAAYTILNGIKVTTSGSTFTVDGKSRKVGVLIEGDYNEITRSTFQLNASGTTEWVLIAGNSNHNRVDYSEFGPNSQSGHYIMPVGYGTIPGVTNPSDRTSWANYNSPYNPNMPRYTQIDHNYFHDNAAGESICLGCAGMAGDYQDTYMVVENNLFVNCDGDAEIVAIKSSNNTVRYNTIRTSSGMLSSRSGNKNSIYGNFMLQGNKSGAGGIKMYEKDHKVYNNYIENASEYPILIGAGDNYTSSSFAHAQVYRAMVVNNTLVGVNNRPVIIGHGSNDNLPPVDSVFANNIVTGSASSLLNKRITSNTVFSKNIAQGTLGTSASQSEFWMTDPQLTTVNGLQKLSSSSPAINYANTSYTSFVTTDMDGQSRSTPDTGADEYTTAAIVMKPLTTADVGPGAAGSSSSPLRFEGETTTVTTSGITTSSSSDAAASGGAYLQTSSSTNTGSWVEFTVNVPTAGTYNVNFGYKKNTGRGTTQLKIDGANQGSTVDQYASTASFATSNLGSVNLSAGNHSLRFTVTGKNSSSSSYAFTVDYIELTPN
ncbi:chondroitinase-B domain-containing protein [Paenibacillus ferrarius]|uniref:chondroitinase-B domain-containing protein n=1 Tax=Paenibacillus ferrarius TaxID=1469647 RepID=UPI003D26B04A